MRLTYNFYIKGGFSGGEDYRWELIRQWFPGWQYEVFNFFFICFYQQLLILGFTAPIVTAFESNEQWQTLDTIATALFLLLLLGEAIADRQQFVFQTEKYKLKNANRPLGKYSKGFIDTGLWSISRVSFAVFMPFIKDNNSKRFSSCSRLLTSSDTCFLKTCMYLIASKLLL